MEGRELTRAQDEGRPRELVRDRERPSVAAFKHNTVDSFVLEHRAMSGKLVGREKEGPRHINTVRCWLGDAHVTIFAKRLRP